MSSAGKRRCIMGCKLAGGNKLHSFPRNPSRLAEWCRILGIRPKKRMYLCSSHIPDCYIYGGRVSNFAKPNPPDIKKNTASFDDSADETTITKSQIKDTTEKDPLSLNDSVCPLEEDKETENSEECKIEDFEIRKGDNKDMIIKGRFVQTDNYLMVSYTPPKKFSLQKQVILLDEHCTRQLRQIRLINKENNSLRNELKKHDKLLPKLRYLQMQNRFLYAQLKMYQLNKKTVRKRKKKNNIKNLENANNLVDNTSES